jgi:signal transduction histidine kinase
MALGHWVRLLLDDRRAWVRVPLRLSLSVVAAAASLWVVELLQPLVGFPVLFPAFVGIVLMAAGAAGTFYGIVTMVLFGAGHLFFFMEPRGTFGLDDARLYPVLAVYVAAGVAVAATGGALRKAHASLREEHRAVLKIHHEREDLLKALSHDVRTPLGTISMNAAMLERSPQDPTVVLRRAHAIERSAASVAAMLSALVDTAHLESGHVRLERRPVELASFLADLEARLGETLPLDRVTLSIPEGVPAIQADPQSLERIVVNLLSNALKYAPPPAPVVVSAAAQGQEVVVSVADGGPGISPEDLPHLFEKYFRARATRSAEGLGLGLYSTRLLVEAHGGRIWVDSAVGRGTTFHVALSAAPAARPSPARAAPGIGPAVPARP